MMFAKVTLFFDYVCLQQCGLFYTVLDFKSQKNNVTKVVIRPTGLIEASLVYKLVHFGQY